MPYDSPHHYRIIPQPPHHFADVLHGSGGESGPLKGLIALDMPMVRGPVVAHR